MKLYPILFENQYKTAIWGGHNLERHGKKQLPEKVSESWEVAANASGMSIVANGPLSGTSLADLSATYKEDLLGTDIPHLAMQLFPLLIKFIDANDRLSVQVHPNDQYAAMMENGEAGKTEMWYVLEASADAKVVYGFVPGTTKESLQEALTTGNIEAILNYRPVKAGDVLFIPAGTVHAIGAGIVLAEVQQNSNLTYRLYDYNRIDASGNTRELHIQKACDIVKTDDNTMSLTNSQDYRYDGDGYSREVMTACAHFVVEQVHIISGSSMVADGTRFHILIIISGAFALKWQDGMMQISAGQTVLIPASIGLYDIIGEATILVVYMPRSNAEGSINSSLGDRNAAVNLHAAMMHNATHISALNENQRGIHAGTATL